MTLYPLRPLADLCERVTDGTHQPPKFTSSGIPFLFVSNIVNGQISFATTKFIAPDTHCELNRRCPVEVGDVIVSTVGSYGNAAVVHDDRPFSFQRHIAHIKLKTNLLDAVYLVHALHSAFVRAQIDKSVRGVAQKTLNLSELKKLQIPAPAINEQRRIADVLDRAEALRAKRRAALAELDGLDDAIFVDLFGDTSSNPKLWETVQIRDIGDIQGGLQVTTARALLPLEIPYLRVANVYRDRVDLSEVKFIRATELEVARTSLAFHDLLIVEGHGNPLEIGRCGLWKREISPCVHQNHLIRVRVDNTRVDPVFAWRYLNTIGGRRDLLRAAKTTSGLNTISVSNVKDASLWLPPLALQQEFARRVAAVEKLKAVQRASLAELDALFASLQDRAFRGAL